MTNKSAREYLSSQLQAQLYSGFYIRGGCISEAWEQSSFGIDSTSFAASLSLANAGTGCVQGGWKLIASSEREWVVQRGNGVKLSVFREQCVPTSEKPDPGSIVSLRLHKELTSASPGYYMALSNRDHPEGDKSTTLRLYWNLKAEGSAHLVRLCTRELNEQNLFFRLKVLNDPASYIRCDGGVLYVRKADYSTVAAFLKRTLPQLAPYLNPEVPVFTKCLAPGLGFAEDPEGRESFGQHRCRVLADGLIRAYEQKARHLDDRLGIVVDHFGSQINLRTPYMNNESLDNYGVIADEFGFSRSE